MSRVTEMSSSKVFQICIENLDIVAPLKAVKREFDPVASYDKCADDLHNKDPRCTRPFNWFQYMILNEVAGECC